MSKAECKMQAYWCPRSNRSGLCGGVAVYGVGCMWRLRRAVWVGEVGL